MSSREEKLALARKTSAQQLARSATQAISDRKLRALAKADVYGQVLPLLEAHYSAQQHLHRTYRRLLTWTGGALILTLAMAVYFGREVIRSAA